VILGILVATLANHALAAWLGAEVAGAIGRDAMRWILGLSFLAMAAWTLIRTTGRGKAAKCAPRRVRRDARRLFPRGDGDKTQIATAALPRATRRLRRWSPARRSAYARRCTGVFFGERILRRVSAKTVHRVAAAGFALLGALALVGAG